MSIGYFIGLGDKTTCGGNVLDGDYRLTIHGVLHAREGDRVTCGKDGNTYRILGGIPHMTSHGKPMAGTLDSFSSCPCRAKLIPSVLTVKYRSAASAAPQTASAWTPNTAPAPASASAAAPANAKAPTQESPLEEEEEEEELEQNTLVLRVGLFFDGTLNNATNTAMGILCGAHHAIEPGDLNASCRPYMADPDSSYGNDLSNVAKLHDLYFAPKELQPGEQSELAFRKIYIDGIGSVAGQKDSGTGASVGRGDTGVAGRVQSAFDEIGRLIRDIYKQDPNNQITGIIFDTFGFSRGAAAARHFSTEVARGQNGPLKDVLRNNKSAFSREFTGDYQRGFKMGFIGLFDTVAAIGGLNNHWDISSGITPGIDIVLPPETFRDVVQLVARDECRVNFALNRVGPEHTEIVLPGVHSDLGGGYRPEADERVLVSPMQGLTVAANCDVKTTSIYREAQQAKLQMIAKGWPAEMLEIITPPSLELPPDPQDRMAPKQKRVFASLQLTRTVRGELSRIYLRVMYELAKQNSVKFDNLNELKDDYRLPLGLQSLCEHFVAGDYSTTPAEEAQLKLRYIHTSANWNNPITEKHGQGWKLLYFNAPTENSIRVQHPHAVSRRR